MWRSRTRANYGDPSMFYIGTLSQLRSVSYVQSVQLVTSTTMLIFEGLVAQRAAVVEDARTLAQGCIEDGMAVATIRVQAEAAYDLRDPLTEVLDTIRRSELDYTTK